MRVISVTRDAPVFVSFFDSDIYTLMRTTNDMMLSEMGVTTSSYWLLGRYRPGNGGEDGTRANETACRNKAKI
ncbi:hypothetical protein PAXRUDRAFT_824253 [Paxillus rubicundulus Ve08.2h10]|uniref:Uncharacterized protein n=1 Tax=Paxillus rubicundulus Ve08.2h10 TaxID=930991 RepID=A0A0D0E2B3_9AGAM|nr:hypothetical protein PAXRUDRAFT_824253 [Paxillus rubicundulus Ve08.2h10]